MTTIPSGPIGPAVPAPASGAIGIEVIGAAKNFGAFRALDDVSIRVAPGTVHALLGENGAGKSTLVKGLVGYGVLDAGQILLRTPSPATGSPHGATQDREVRIASPRDAQALGIGMVYQHFTLAGGMTVEENLVLSRGDLPWRIDWRRERAALEGFLRTMPFRLALDRQVSGLAAGEKQKLEILKQLYLRQRFLILDEPTSVLTPQEADEVLGLMRDLTRAGSLTVLMITHKFREVMAYADDVTVLRKGRLAGASAVARTDPGRLGAWMMGTMPHDAGEGGSTAASGEGGGQESSLGSGVAANAPQAPGKGQVRAARQPADPHAPVRLAVAALTVADDRGHHAVRDLSLQVRAGEILGIAGVSGNGQRELVEALVGQRKPVAGAMEVSGAPYRATRAEMTQRRLFAIPEEPLRNACVAGMSVAENLALRDFDRAPMRRAGWRLDFGAIRRRAAQRIAEFNVRPPRPEQAIGTLSGGNVQRAVLARELGQPVDVLVVANPVFGLDFASVADIHARLVAARDAGAAVLLVSEDLDELLELADRIAVMAEGSLVYETEAAQAEPALLGRYMAGHDGHEMHGH